MDIQRMITELRLERECLDGALMNLHKLALRRAPRRGRPPAWDAVVAVAKKPQPVVKRKLHKVAPSKVMTAGMG
jgi:hypothetical protein